MILIGATRGGGGRVRTASTSAVVTAATATVFVFVVVASATAASSSVIVSSSSHGFESGVYLFSVGGGRWAGRAVQTTGNEEKMRQIIDG